MEAKSTIAQKIRDGADQQIAQHLKQQKIIDAIRAGVDKVKHHQNYTKRVLDAVKAELQKAFPEDQNIVVSDHGYAGLNLRVWNVAGLDYNNCIDIAGYLSVYRIVDGERKQIPQSWNDALIEGLGRYDTPRWIASLQELKQNADEIAAAEQRIQALRDEASAMAKNYGTYGFPSFVKEIAPNVYGA